MKCFIPNFAKRGGLVNVVTIDELTRDVLMVAYADEEAFRMTLKTAEAHYHSTSKKCLWKKGGTSGCVQHVSDMPIDCDGDAIIYVVRQDGVGACHTDAKSCFYRSVIGAKQIMDAPKAGDAESLRVEEIGLHWSLEGLA